MIGKVIDLTRELELRQDQRIFLLNIRKSDNVDSPLVRAELILGDIRADSTTLVDLPGSGCDSDSWTREGAER